MRLSSSGFGGWGWILTCAVVSLSCGDDGGRPARDAGGGGEDASTPREAGSPRDTGTAPRDASSSRDSGTSTADASTPQADSGGMLMSGECTNDADLAVIGSTDMEQIAEDCGTECFFGGDDCVSDCIEEESGVSTACAGCFAIPVDCTIDNCVPSPCGPGTGDSEGCVDCRCGRTGGPNCIEMFVQCSGLPSDDCAM